MEPGNRVTFSQTRKVLATQKIAMQGFVKLCSMFGDLLLVYKYMYMYIHV